MYEQSLLIHRIVLKWSLGQWMLSNTAVSTISEISRHFLNTLDLGDEALKIEFTYDHPIHLAASFNKQRRAGDIFSNRAPIG